MLKLGHKRRSPNHRELYSFYVYDPLDNSFYIGNPDLNTENSLNTELNLNLKMKSMAHNITIFNDNYSSFIIGEQIIEPNPDSRLFSQAFRKFTNLNSTNIYGIEYQSTYSVFSKLTIDYTLRYTPAYSNAINDNLPFIAPLSSTLSLNYSIKSLNLKFDWIYNGQQNHNSDYFYLENKTEEFHLFNSRIDYSFWKIKVAFGIENILDVYYIEHTSINDLPSLGRNVYLQFDFGV